MKHFVPFKQLRILFADDDPHFGASTCKLLEMLFDRVHYAPNGHEALRLYEQECVHIVMIDVRLGDISGLEVARTIRQNNHTIPIFLVSSYTEREDLLEACRYHLVEYLVKPFSFDLLMNTLNKCWSEIQKNNTFNVVLSESLYYNLSQKSLLCKGDIVPLTKSERIVLELLLHNKGNIVSYHLFHQSLGSESSSASLKNIVLRLRHKMGEPLIYNISQEGYKLI